MPNSHVDKWAERASQDFYMMFVKSWIPFNAWYHRECELARLSPLTDSNCIKYVCENTNVFKTKIISFLQGNDKPSMRFVEEIGELQNALKRHILYDKGVPINFSTMVPNVTSANLVVRTYRQYRYKVERTQNGSAYQYNIFVEDKTTHVPKYSKQLNSWKKEDLEGDSNYINISSTECKSKILEYFELVNPKKPLNIVIDTRTTRNGNAIIPTNSLEMGKGSNVFFINDPDKIARVLIHLLYKLRCQIFHGSIDPTLSNMEIYEHAYYIQYQLIKELI